MFRSITLKIAVVYNIWYRYYIICMNFNKELQVFLYLYLITAINLKLVFIICKYINSMRGNYSVYIFIAVSLSMNLY